MSYCIPILRAVTETAAWQVKRALQDGPTASSALQATSDWSQVHVLLSLRGDLI